MTAADDNPRQGIALIGLRGSGKTTVGHELATLLGATHADTDDLIVAVTGQSITDIFRDRSEAAFRELECQIVAQLVQNPPRVISVGGGAVLDSANVAALRAVARVVWLTAPPSVLWKRIQNDPRTAANRPALTNCGGRAGMAKLLMEREPIYRDAADAVIDTVDKTPEAVARETIHLLGM